MCRSCQLDLSPQRRRSLTAVRDHHTKPYMREKAAALLKLADGWTIKDIAQFGLLRPRARNTVAAWGHRYETAGLRGLAVRPGRGRKSAFSPL